MNKTANYQLTVIVPVYNEEGNILRLEKELGEFLKEAKVSSCVLFVNDGSKDNSERLIREVCGRNEAFFFLNLIVVIPHGWVTLMQISRPPRKISIICWKMPTNTKWLWESVRGEKIVLSRICHPGLPMVSVG